MGWIYLIVVLSFVFGMAPLPWWSWFLWSLICIGLGVASVETEPENYDMSGFGLYVSLFMAGACMLGRAFRLLMIRLSQRSF